MEFGIILLPQQRWALDARRWRRAEALGFDVAWTYDHLSWRSLVDEPWLATVPLLAAAATVTTTMRVGTWVASPNFRHPVPFAKDVMGLDDISGGRFVLGVGAGGVGWDATVLGHEVLSPGARVDRFEEFTALLDELLTHPSTTRAGTWFSAQEARMVPGPFAGVRPPLVLAANGPRGMRVAARYGDGWATTGSDAADDDAWWRGVADLAARFGDVADAAGRGGATVGRYLHLDHGGAHVLASPERFTDAVGRAAGLGFTHVATHWPRENGIYAGSESMLEQVAALLPSLRGAGTVVVGGS